MDENPPAITCTPINDTPVFSKMKRRLTDKKKIKVSLIKYSGLF